MHLQQAIDAYLAHLTEYGRKDRTVNAYRYDFKLITAFFGSERLLSEITLPLVGKFLRSDELLLRQDSLQRCENMVNRIRRVLRMFLFWAYEQSLIEFLPIPKSLPLGRNKFESEVVYKTSNEYAYPL